MLLHQFHDILPGSSIAWVHRESARDLPASLGELEEIIAAAQRALAGDAGSGGRVVFNAAPHERDGVPAGGATALSAADAGHGDRRRRRVRAGQRRSSGRPSTRAGC